MHRLLFLSRLAFICNAFFALAVSLQFWRWFQNMDAEATTIIIGYFMAALFNPLANICYGLLFFINRSKLAVVPLWLRIANFIFLVFQVIFIFQLNGK